MAPLCATRWHGEGLVAIASPSRLAVPLPAQGAITSQVNHGSFDALNASHSWLCQCQILSYLGDIGVALHSRNSPTPRATSSTSHSL